MNIKNCKMYTFWISQILLQKKLAGSLIVDLKYKILIHEYMFLKKIFKQIW